MSEAGPRLDLWLARERGITRHAAQVLIEAGLVTVNGRPARAGRAVAGSDVVAVSEAPPASEVPTEAGPAVALDVVYEDDALVVINKPVGMVVHPAAGHPDGTLADGLRQRGSTWSLLGGGDRPGIVHRLDRDTSGLLVAAKTEDAHRALQAQLVDRSLGRHYWALVEGMLAESSGRIEAPIGRDPHDRKRMAVIESGREAITDFVVSERLTRHTVLDVRLQTGRTHQIRVHLAYIGHPVAGDPVYGRRSSVASRLALHARELHFLHPGDGRSCHFEAPLPDDLVALHEYLRGAPA